MQWTKEQTTITETLLRKLNY